MKYYETNNLGNWHKLKYSVIYTHFFDFWKTGYIITPENGCECKYQNSIALIHVKSLKLVRDKRFQLWKLAFCYFAVAVYITISSCIGSRISKHGITFLIQLHLPSMELHSISLISNLIRLTYGIVIGFSSSGHCQPAYYINLQIHTRHTANDDLYHPRQHWQANTNIISTAVV